MTLSIPAPIKRHRIQIGDPDHVVILLVGCGGTGSFAALHLARLAYEARRGGGPVLQLVFVDPDTVEQKNIGRQNFCPAEIGEPKAMALASRYNLAFGLEIGAIVGRFAEAGLVKLWADRSRQSADLSLLLIVGCVDSPAAREEIADSACEQLRGLGRKRRNIWWLDAGNDEHSGQVLIGNNMDDEPTIDPTLGCVGLPLPSFQEPALVTRPPAPAPADENLSCAELLELNVQSLMINQAMAGWIGVYASRLLLSRDLDIYQTWVDLRAGATRSVAITEGVTLAVGETIETVEETGPPELIGQAVGHCPNCGQLIFEGRDTLDDAIGEEDIVFCPACNWNEYLDDWEAREGDAREELIAGVRARREREAEVEG